MTVILFLRDTLKSELFVELLVSRGRALHIYLRHLNEIRNYTDQVGLLRHACSPHALVIAMLKRSFTIKQPEARLAAFNECLIYMEADPKVFEFQIKILKEQITLLQYQIALEKRDIALAAQGHQSFLRWPRRPILYATMGTTVYYTIFYHSAIPKDHFASPKYCKAKFKISERRFFFLRLRVLAAQQQWDAVRALPSSSLFSSTPKSIIGFTPFVQAIHDFGGPIPLLREFLHYVTPENKRFKLAVSYAQYDIALDLAVAMRSRARVEQLLTVARKLGPVAGLELRTRAEAALQSPKIKWANEDEEA